MEAILAKACKSRYSDEIDIDNISRIRIHGYEVSIQKDVAAMLEIEETYEELRHGHIAGALILEHQKSSGDRRTDAVVEQQVSQSFLQEHQKELNFKCENVDKEQQRLEKIIRAYFSPDSEWAKLVNPE